MLPQTAKSVAYFYSATLAWNVSAVDRKGSGSQTGPLFIILPSRAAALRRTTAMPLPSPCPRMPSGALRERAPRRRRPSSTGLCRRLRQKTRDDVRDRRKVGSIELVDRLRCETGEKRGHLDASGEIVGVHIKVIEYAEVFDLRPAQGDLGDFLIAKHNRLAKFDVGFAHDLEALIQRFAISILE